MGILKAKKRRPPSRGPKRPIKVVVRRERVDVVGRKFREVLADLRALVDILATTDPPGLRGENITGSPVGKTFTHWRVPLRNFLRKYIGN